MVPGMKWSRCSKVRQEFVGKDNVCVAVYESVTSLLPLSLGSMTIPDLSNVILIPDSSTNSKLVHDQVANQIDFEAGIKIARNLRKATKRWLVGSA